MNHMVQQTLVRAKRLYQRQPRAKSQKPHSPHTTMVIAGLTRNPPTCTTAATTCSKPTAQADKQNTGCQNPLKTHKNLPIGNNI